jgi:hypothetical protein
MLLRSAPVPAGDVQAAAAGAPALVENGGERKGLGALSMFRGSSQSRAAEERSPATNKNGNPNAKARNGKPPSPKQGEQAPKGTQAKQGQARQGQGQSGRQGTSSNRRSGSRSSGKGKSSGPRRGKR